MLLVKLSNRVDTNKLSVIFVQTETNIMRKVIHTQFPVIRF